MYLVKFPSNIFAPIGDSTFHLVHLYTKRVVLHACNDFQEYK